LIADGCPNEIGTIGVEPLPDEQIDMTEIDIAEIDRDLLTIACPRTKFSHISSHVPSSNHLHGWYLGLCGRTTRPVLRSFVEMICRPWQAMATEAALSGARVWQGEERFSR
jgi:hypothetical protein